MPCSGGNYAGEEGEVKALMARPLKETYLLKLPNRYNDLQ